MRIDAAERFAFSFMYGNTQFRTKTQSTFRTKKVDLLLFRPVAGGGAGGLEPPQKFSDLIKILLQKWNFSTKMDSCQWNLKFQSIVDHSKIMYCCSSGPSCSKAD